VPCCNSVFCHEWFPTVASTLQPQHKRLYSYRVDAVMQVVDQGRGQWRANAALLLHLRECSWSPTMPRRGKAPESARTNVQALLDAEQEARRTPTTSRATRPADSFEGLLAKADNLRERLRPEDSIDLYTR
jgi:hypothetical protein